MKLFGQKVFGFFFPSMLIPADHWKCCKFLLFEISAQMKCMAACFLFYWIFFSISVLCLRTTNPYLTHKASWVLEACWFRLSLSYEKHKYKKGWMCIYLNEMWNKTTTIHPHCQLMVYSCFMYYTSVKDKPPHTKPKPYMEKELPRAQFLF